LALSVVLLLMPLQAAMAKVLEGQQLVLRNRPDAAFFAQQEEDALHTVQQLLPRCECTTVAWVSQSCCNSFHRGGNSSGSSASINGEGQRCGDYGAVAAKE
jgi:hypothetical protein